MYRTTTNNITVLVEPFYSEEQSRPDDQHFVFGYNIRVENEGDQSVTLMRRHWKITDERGRISEISGDGVLGEQPEIPSGEHFEYTSGAPLDTPSGIMLGYYTMIDEERNAFHVTIPPFSLDAPSFHRSLH